jgi:hypothetical protein
VAVTVPVAAVIGRAGIRSAAEVVRFCSHLKSAQPSSSMRNPPFAK